MSEPNRAGDSYFSGRANPALAMQPCKGRVVRRSCGVDRANRWKAQVLTPPSIVKTLAVGWHPQLHPSARGLAAG